MNTLVIVVIVIAVLTVLFLATCLCMVAYIRKKRFDNERLQMADARIRNDILVARR